MKIKKKLKGVTLCEVLVAMTIFAVMMLVVTTMIATTSKMNIKNHKMNKQMQTQGAKIEQNDKPALPKSSNTFDFNFNGYSSSTTIYINDEATGGDYAHYKYYSKP